jgi:hypothetical protein
LLEPALAVNELELLLEEHLSKRKIGLLLRLLPAAAPGTVVVVVVGTVIVVACAALEPAVPNDGLLLILMIAVAASAPAGRQVVMRRIVDAHTAARMVAVVGVLRARAAHSPIEKLDLSRDPAVTKPTRSK